MPYNSHRAIPIVLLVSNSDSSDGATSAGTMGRQACLELVRTHFGQKRLPQSGQRCQNPGFPPPHTKPLHLTLLVFFMIERTGVLARAWMLEPGLWRRKAEVRAWYVPGEGKRRKTSRFGIQVRNKEKGMRERERVGQEEMQGGGARDMERREPNTCRLSM